MVERKLRSGIDGEVFVWRWSTIAHDVGLLIHLPAAMALPSIVIVVATGEWIVLPGFLVMGCVSLVLGPLLCRFPAGDSRSPQGLIVVGLAWLLIALLGAIPFHAPVFFGNGIDETARAYWRGARCSFRIHVGLHQHGPHGVASRTVSRLR